MQGAYKHVIPFVFVAMMVGNGSFSLADSAVAHALEGSASASAQVRISVVVPVWVSLSVDGDEVVAKSNIARDTGVSKVVSCEADAGDVSNTGRCSANNNGNTMHTVTAL